MYGSGYVLFNVNISTTWTESKCLILFHSYVSRLGFALY